MTARCPRYSSKNWVSPSPISLGVGSGSHREQTGRLLVELEKVMVADRPDLVVVVGDVNSTMAAAIDAAKLGIPVAHVEAGLRSFDRSMPEEINRIVTDALSDLLFVSEDSGRENLFREGARAPIGSIRRQRHDRLAPRPQGEG